MQLLKQFKLLASGSLAAGIINLVSISICANYLAPDDFGLFAVFSSIVMVFSTISTLKFDSYICQKKHTNRAVALFFISILNVFFISLILFFVLDEKIIASFFKVEFDIMKYFIPLSVLFLGVYQASSSYALFNKAYKKISVSKVLQAMLGGLVQVILIIYFKVGILSLVIGFITNQSMGSSLLLSGFKIKFNKYLILRMKILFKKYVARSLSISLSTFISILSPMLPVIIITHYVGGYEAGLFYFAIQITSIPFSYLRRICSQIIIGEFNSNNTISFVVNKFKIYFVILLLFAFYYFYFYVSGPIFSMIFGIKWFDCGLISFILLPMLFFDMISFSCYQYLNLSNKQSFLLFVEVFRFVVSILLGLVVIDNFDFIYYVYYYSLSITLFNVIVACYAYKYRTSTKGFYFEM